MNVEERIAVEDRREEERDAWIEQEERGEGLIAYRAYLSTLWRRKWVIVFTMVFSIGLTMAVLQQITPQYTATAQVMLNTRETNVVDIESVISGLPANAGIADGEIAVITSIQLLERVVDKLRLERDPEFNPPPRPPSFIAEWKQSLKESLPEDVRIALGISDEPKITDAALQAEAERRGVIARLGNALKVRQRGKSVVLLISLTAGDPRKAALIANTIADQYLVDQLEAKFEATKRATAWLNERLSGLRDKVEQAESAVAAFKESQSIGEGGGVEIINQQLGEINSLLVTARAARAEAEARYEQVRRRVDQGGLAAAANVLTSPLILTLRQQRAVLAREVAELSTRYGDRHPKMINIRAEIGGINSAIASEVRKIVENLKNDLEVAQARENTLTESLGELEDRAFGQSKTSVQLRQLEREAEASQLIYQNFLNRFKETSEQEGLQQADARIISEATPPGAPSKPNRKRSLNLAGFFGLIGGIGLVFLLEALNNTFRTVAELEERTGLVVLASLPLVGRRLRRGKVLSYVLEKPNCALAEAVRNLRTALLLSNIDQPPQTVMITSSVPTEGKSTTCILLAHMSAQVGKSAVIVECDIRRPTLHKTFGIEDGHGIISVLDGTVTLDEALWQDEATGFAVLPAIRSTPQAADIMSSKRFGAMIEDLRKRYDLILLDTPPVLLVSDAGVVGQYADTTIYTVRWDHTPRDAAMQGLKQLRELGVRVSGAVVTLIDQRRAARYSYSRYGYGYYAGDNAYYAD